MLFQLTRVHPELDGRTLDIVHSLNGDGDDNDDDNDNDNIDDADYDDDDHSDDDEFRILSDALFTQRFHD